MKKIVGRLPLLHYAAIFPSELRADHPENLCVQVEGAQGETSVKVTLKLDTKDTSLIDEKFHKDSIFTCRSVQVPIPEENEAVGTITLSIENSGESVTNTSKVLVKKPKSKILVQTDKAVYNPGQTVKFRILSLNEDFKPENTLIPVVEVQDPDKNRIKQWLNVKLEQGIAEMSFTLIPEPKLGEYSIKLKDTSHTFTVEEYVLPKFEVTMHFPKSIPINIHEFPVKVCAKYTYGKPVHGNVEVRISREPYFTILKGEPQLSISLTLIGELDKSGCYAVNVHFSFFDPYDPKRRREMSIEASVTEEGTGVEIKSSGQAHVTNAINKLSFVNADDNYKAGLPYSGVITVEDAGGVPKPNITVYLKCNYNTVCQTLVTDESGQASFTLNTTDWKGAMTLSAQIKLTPEPYVEGKVPLEYGEAAQHVLPLYSRSKSFLKLNSLDKVLPCEGHQEVHAEYIISHTELKEAKTLSLHYLLVSKVSIKKTGTVEIKPENTNEDIHGKVTLNLPLSEGTSKILHVLVYIILPSAEILADTAKYNVQKCFKNKVSTEFSPHEVLPRSDVALQVEASPGSLCGLRVVDQSVVLMKPEKELTADKVLDLFPSAEFGWYDFRIQDDGDTCGFRPFPRPPILPGRSLIRPIWPRFPRDESVDVYSFFKNLQLKIITSADIKKPCPKFPLREFDNFMVPAGGAAFPSTPMLTSVVEKESAIEEVDVEASKPQPKETAKPRTYFPETWIWQLAALGESGRAEIHHKAPDTITDWNAGAICMGPSGFGISPSSSLRVFQPFFVDVTLPYSVNRGETFALKALVFNYLKKCIKVQTTLKTTDELEEIKCDDCSYSSCICPDESETFKWNLKAKKLGEVNIIVTTEIVYTKEFCESPIFVVPNQGKADTIVKTVLVQPGGILVEKSHSSLICLKEGGDPKVKEISLKIPDNILKDSARAHITMLGDLMGTAMQNLDRLLAMPYGCGEQNMVLFAPNIFILNYVERTHQLTDEILNKAKTFMESGYQRQITYKHDDGSYSAFGKSDKEGNTWLTGFVVKSFSKARPYIFIDESHLNHSLSWLKNIQEENGSFRSVGKLFNNAMKGGLEDGISLTAYITLCLLEAGMSPEEPVLSKAISYLKKSCADVSNVYTQALLAYTFSLCEENELRESLLDKLEKKAVRGDGQLHLKRDSTPPPEDSYWYRAPSAEVEMTSYMLLALLTCPSPDIGKASLIVNWLSKQQNSNGGYSSTQDTVVALQALAKYAEETFSDKGDVTVEVSSKSGFHEQFHVDQNNRLLVQRATLPKIPEDYTVTSKGAGCVFVQAVLRYNVPPPGAKDTFSLSVKTSSKKDCLKDSVTKFEVLINAAYTGTREKSNMAIIEVKMLSGYIPVKSTIKKLEKDKLIQRSEIAPDLVTLYLNEIGPDTVTLPFMVEQDIVVKDLKPASARMYDYYETDDHTSVEYKHPCSED
ncbi:alpha-2-macroglobulin-like [Leptodactylus fuscus]